MTTVLLVIHLMVAAAMVAVVLLQRSEGGALGMGGSNSGLMTGRGTANLLTRTTSLLAAAFFATSLSLSLLGEDDRNVFDRLQSQQPQPLQTIPQGTTENTTTAPAPTAPQPSSAPEAPRSQ